MSGYTGAAISPDDLARQGTYWHHSGTPGHVKSCKDRRLPPLVPEEFAARAEDKALTNGKDKEVLLKLQAIVSTSVLSEVIDMSFTSLGWGNSDAALLAKALLLSSRLRTLNLCQNHIGADGARPLAAAIAGAGSLTKIE